MTIEVDLAGPDFHAFPRGMAKYEYLRAGIAAAIESGRFQPGAKLPPELDMAAQTRLSLGTVQRALRELALQGYVIRRPGTGTFVADRRRRLEEPLHCRFLNEETGALLPVYSRLLQRRRVTDQGPWSPVLGRDTLVLRLDRTIDIDGLFTVASHLYLDARRFPAFEKMPKQKFAGANIKKLLFTQFGVEIITVEQRMRIVAPDQEILEWLELPKGTPVLRLDGIAYGAPKVAVYFQQLWVPQTPYPLIVNVPA